MCKSRRLRGRDETNSTPSRSMASSGKSLPGQTLHDNDAIENDSRTTLSVPSAQRSSNAKKATGPCLVTNSRDATAHPRRLCLFMGKRAIVVVLPECAGR